MASPLRRDKRQPFLWKITVFFVFFFLPEACREHPSIVLPLI